MRVVWFFAYVFLGMVGLPALILFMVERQTGALQWPPPPAFGFDPAWTVQGGVFADPARLLATSGPVVDARSILPAAQAAAANAEADGTIAVAVRLKRAQDMASALDALARQHRIDRRIPGRAGETVSTAQGMSGLLLHDATRILLVLGLREGAAEARLARLPGLTLKPNPAAAKRPSRTVLFLVAGGVFAWAVAQIFIFCRLASWAGSVQPAPGTTPMPASELERRLLALNGGTVPFSVRRGARPGELVVDWRYADAKWFDLMRVAGLSRLFRVVLRLDDDGKCVRARDYTADIDWSAGRGGGDFAFKASLGINFFIYRREAVVGLQIRGGQPTFDPFYHYRFSLRELRDPLIAAVTGAGWSYRPVLTFFRPVGG